ncbi:MAG: acryloyl-CoA reductase [Ectothiorhodospiraceae bacterium]|nr:acryloyl-CoA reductase [Ectothiorhodospiraceae bacterium]MCH8504949.1 acryloyl-CoA reductase [Ectothiorhodospiraceae bacterium]
MTTFSAYRLEEREGKSVGAITRMRLADLDEGGVVIRSVYAGVNYKDALAGTGAAPIIRRFPCVGGIEAVGVVVESDSDGVREGDEVIVHGRGIGVSHDGGFSEYVRVPADWVTHLPRGLDMHEAAAIGVAGHTAAVAVDLMELNGLKPSRGPVVVTGATGGVASLAIDMMSGLGYELVAVSRKLDQRDYLTALGATDVIQPPSPEESGRPLESAEWAGAVDAAGGHLLSWVLRKTRPGGTVACFGNAAGIKLDMTVLPFILRGVRLLGVNADTEPAYRLHIWNRLATDLKPTRLEAITRDITLDELPATFERMVEGRTTGRHVVRFAD